MPHFPKTSDGCAFASRISLSEFLFWMKAGGDSLCQSLTSLTFQIRKATDRGVTCRKRRCGLKRKSMLGREVTFLQIVGVLISASFVQIWACVWVFTYRQNNNESNGQKTKASASASALSHKEASQYRKLIKRRGSKNTLRIRRICLLLTSGLAVSQPGPVFITPQHSRERHESLASSGHILVVNAPPKELPEVW